MTQWGALDVSNATVLGSLFPQSYSQFSKWVAIRDGRYEKCIQYSVKY